jgi:hypothetical protein
MKAESHTSRARTAHLALALAVVVAAPLTAFVAMGRADAASGTVFEVGQVIAEIKRQIAAADAGAGASVGLRIEDAQLDLALVEHPGGRGALVVAGADYTAGTKEETPRPALKRRLVLEVQPARTPPAQGASPAAEAAAPTGGRLAQTIGELRGSVQQTMASDPAYELKKFTIDLDFALERDGKGALQLVVFARDKRIDPTNVHGLKLRLATPSPPREKDARANKEASAKGRD